MFKKTWRYLEENKVSGVSVQVSGQRLRGLGVSVVRLTANGTFDRCQEREAEELKPARRR